jgi:muramoyltetrapeptide carboxypeptidase
VKLSRRRLFELLGLSGIAAAASRPLAGLTMTSAPATTQLAALLANQPAPKPLRPGDRLIAVAPGTWVDPQDLIGPDSWKGIYARWGLELIVPPQAIARWRYFSANDRERSNALNQSWSDNSASGVVCISGGWGAARALEAGFKPNPASRWCVGFSDNSALLLAQLAAGGRGGIHGWKGERVRQLLMGEALAPLQGRGLVAGACEGPLVVTNLTVATHLIGTPWLPPLRGAILVLEDTGEAPYRIDRLLTHWRTAGLLQDLAGIGLGRFSWKADDVLPGDLSMDEVLQERLSDLGIPVVSQLPVGHGRPNEALPQGGRARLDGRTGVLDLVAAGT